MLGNYVTVRRYEGVADPQEAAKRAQESFVPILKKIRGFVGYYCVNAGDGVLVTVSIFQDQAGEEESNAQAKEWVKHNPIASSSKPPQVTAGRVVAHS